MNAALKSDLGIKPPDTARRDSGFYLVDHWRGNPAPSPVSNR